MIGFPRIARWIRNNLIRALNIAAGVRMYIAYSTMAHSCNEVCSRIVLWIYYSFLKATSFLIQVCGS